MRTIRRPWDLKAAANALSLAHGPYPRWFIQIYAVLYREAISWARAAESIEQRVFDRVLGVSTRGVNYTDDTLTTTGSDNLFYDNCGWLPVRRALKDLAPGPNDVFVDLGSGKGQALLIAAQLPFRRVVGVELYDALCECANRNIERARPRLQTQDVVSLTANVLDWPIPDDASVVFMYNPFVGETFRAVAGRIFESYDRRPRTLHIVYTIPWEHNWLLSTGRVVVDNVRPWRFPAFPLWWRRGLVIVSYRVVEPEQGRQVASQLPRRIFGQRRQAMRSWAGPNPFCFGVSQPGRQTVFSRSW
jgi:SAM-dependent methyltransferase